MADNPATEETSSKRMDDHALLLLILVGIIALAVFLNWFFTDKFEIRSECKNIGGGVKCAVTHTSKNSRDIAICTDIKRVCTNGMSSTARGCFKGLIAPGTSGELLVANSEFSNFADCKISAQTESIEVQQDQAPQPSKVGG